MSLHQTKLINKLYKKFELRCKSKTYKTPMLPGSGVIRVKEESELLSEMDQHLYRSGVGTLLYLIKHSRPDICNGVRELSKVMDRGNSAHFEEMLRVVDENGDGAIGIDEFLKAKLKMENEHEIKK